ncbi:MAG: hypothetical protein PHU64_02840 [Candidatus Omnitrophica bacterium]|nr:hypothetical protein [Candidatus Omnitrophota bacterium]MDD5429472.1 hypothetical protein [Candidatus Omnitrophota bacterium]
MKKFIFLLLIFLLPAIVSAKIVSLEELLKTPENFDGKYLQVEGEVIGESLSQGDGAWVNISSSGYHMGIFFSRPQIIKAIHSWGGYCRKGDVIRVKGKFFKQCQQHQLTDIHAQSIKVIEKGYKFPETVSLTKIKASGIAVVICLAAALVYIVREKYGRKN